VKKQQTILLGSGALLFCLIYFFGRTVPEKKPSAVPSATGVQSTDFESILTKLKSGLPPSQQAYLSQMENAVVRGNVKEQQILNFRQLAVFWKDSAHQLIPYAYYLAKAAKLENIEKSLTFAGHYFVDGMRRQSDPSMKKWMALQAKELLEQALTLNPSNDSSKVGLGSCYLFGQISENPMAGIQLIREVADRDSANAFAQLMLGLGGLESGQFDRAIDRLQRVVKYQPDNLEAILALAESYERKGDKANAIEWYTKSRSFFTDKEILQEIDARIDLLKK